MNSILQTHRLTLRFWTMDDLPNFQRLAQNKQVMQFFPHLLSDAACKKWLIENIRLQKKYGFTYFAAERKTSGEFIGFVGLKHQDYQAPFTPTVDIGWRLHPSFWGKGYATEAAQSCLDFAFEDLHLPCVHSCTPKINLPSRKVMERIGMTYCGEFIYPDIAANHRLQPHVFYKKEAPKKS